MTTYSKDTGKPFHLSPEAEMKNLHRHGTKILVLSAKNVLQAAQADARSLAINQETREAPPGDPLSDRKKRPTLFLEAGGVMSAAEILRAALKCHHPPPDARRDVMLVYEDRALLQEALRLAEMTA